jgi:ribosomal-protein-alanine N-acetyltransferase
MISFANSQRIFIEPAQAAHVDAVAAIHDQCFTASWSAEDLAGMLRSERTLGLVLYKRPRIGPRRPVAFIMARRAADEAEILTLAVDPGQRSRGYGKRLVEEAMRRLWKDGADAVFLEVDEDNIPAVKLYQGLGFVVVGRRKGYYRDTEGSHGDALVMRVQLR